MTRFDLFKFSLDNLRRRKGRTVLTIIGVVVGVCAIVVMVSLGIAVNRATDAMLQNWGDLTKVSVMSWGAQQGTPDLDDKMIETFKAMPHVVASTPMYTTRDFGGQLVAGPGDRYIMDGVQLVGVIADSIEPMGYELVTGSFDLDVNLGRNKVPVLIGQQTPFSFRDSKKSWSSPDVYKYQQWDDTWSYIINLPQYDEDGVLLNPDDFFVDMMNTKLTYMMQVGYDDTTDEPKYRNYELVPVGMIAADSRDWMVSGGIIMSLESMRDLEVDYRRETGNRPGGGGGRDIWYGGYGGGGSGDGTTTVDGYETVYVKVDDVRNVESVEIAIKQIGYQISSMSETRNQLQGQVAQTQLMLGGLAAVSLFVAALNIMNTMTMAITERTREIGVMKVLGCRLKDLRRMFLIEAGFIGFIGGLVGCGVSILISLLLNNLPHILMALGIESDIDLAGFFGLGGLASQMPEMALSVIPIWLIFAALAFAAGVGFLSGLAPANRAMRISSLEAIRHE
ncbi:MAG: ABC transporter permease [Clostridiales bacterium]|nr:ABC transporter permease [Clostridiales bacterium]